jgi:hypothetical protein
MNKEIFEKIKLRFFRKLDSKTGWGKEEVKKLFTECTMEELSQYIETTINDISNHNTTKD